ncbi:hypothetical protein AVEN_157348-1 [Araneus ventricosus]|uniref:Uncharacterized protein n=1 Tax=Araneus ventricosus TaxID=182803 RepID=A0A4Y2S3S5_ARAVE|nr:hypothetical protein AVEN_69705-1 [Araneus ventricosus]GBN81921.1 hypothetical protein AVEN_157348-1 [Araneus ventricosus]
MKKIMHAFVRGCGGLVVRFRLWGTRVRNPPKICPVFGPLHIKAYVVVKRPPAGVVWELGEGVLAQVSSTLSDRGSKLRGPSQNSLVFLQNGL